MNGKPKGKVALIIAAVFIIAAFAVLLYGGIGENLVWNVTPNELLAKGDDAYGHAVRLGGQVAPGSVVRTTGQSGVTFKIRDQTGPPILVHSKGIPTAMFREGIGVVVEGKLAKEGDTPVFHATTLMVKHSNEYKPPTEGHPARDMNKTLISE
ncbi:MAG: cytochrome c maturation protein CcmE [Longimicrobiales bacterium]